MIFHHTTFKRRMCFICVVLAVSCWGGGRAWADGLKIAEAYYGRGITEERTGHYREAIEDYRAVLNAAPNYYWAFRELGNCYYYLGYKAWALDAYDRYLSVRPSDLRVKRFADSLRGKKQGQTKGRKSHRMAFGLGCAYESYAMTNWNNQLNQNVVNGSGVYAYSGTPVTSGLGLTTDFRYFLNDKWAVGFFLDYMMAGGSFAANIADGSGVYAERGTYSFPAVLLGPQGSYTFYTPLPNLKVSVSLGLGYLTLLGANLNYSANIANGNGVSAGTQTANLSGSGIGVRTAVGADLAITSNFTLTGELGYRLASIGQVASSFGGDLQSAGNNVTLDFSGFFFDLGLAYWP